MKVLLVVDVQRDFCAGGALVVPQGEEVVPVINRMMRSGEFDLIIATRDWHPAAHVSFADNHPGQTLFSRIDLDGRPQTLWPRHCVQKSAGARFHPDLQTELFSHVIDKGTAVNVDSYSGFFDNARTQETALCEVIEREAAKRGIAIADVELTICGLALDYCVAATARDAAALGFKTAVVFDASRAVNLNPGDDIRTLRELQSIGVTIQESRDLLPQLAPRVGRDLNLHIAL